MGRPLGAKNRPKKCGGRRPHEFKLDEWERGCECSGSKRALARFLGVSKTCLHNFINLEEEKEFKDKNYNSAYLAALKKKRQEFQELAVKAFKNSLEDKISPKGEIIPASPACVIFAMKSVAGFDDTPKLMTLKKQELKIKKEELKIKQNDFSIKSASHNTKIEKFLEELANKYRRDNETVEEVRARLDKMARERKLFYEEENDKKDSYVH